MRTISFIFLIIAISYAQSTKTVDVIYLKDGSIINGEILGIIHNENVKVETNSGNVLLFKMWTVKCIKQETKTVTILKGNKQYPDYDLSYNPNKYTLHKNIGRIGGAAVGIVTIIGSIAMEDGFFATTVIPIVGPFITMKQVENDLHSTYLPGGEELLLASGILQVGFFSIWMVSLFSESMYKSEHRLSIAPTANNIGFTLSYKF